MSPLREHTRARLAEVREAVVIGLEALRAYKMRAGLTILGVVMGIMTVTGMSSIVAGLNANMAAMIQGLGASTVFIRPMAPGENLTSEERRKRKGLTEGEIAAIVERCPDVRQIAPMELLDYQQIKSGNAHIQSTTLLGVGSAWDAVHDTWVDKGRFISNLDVARGARVAVIGFDVQEALFPWVDPVGKELMVDGLRFDVIGVLQRKGKFLGESRDNYILVPLGAVAKRNAMFNALLADFTPVSPAKMGDAMEEVRAELRRQRRLRYFAKDNFAMFTQDTLTDLYNRLTGGIYLVMIAISSIGLVVGGVGVMNIMLVSVTERTREIGIRKALGARRRDVRWQFLTEAMTLTGVGGVLGILIGAGVAWLVNAFSPFPAVVQPTWVTIAFLVSVAVGLVFGLWPAMKAARLDPIEALRYE